MVRLKELVNLFIRFNMKIRMIFLIIATLLVMNSGVIAESQALRDRGARCTDHCTQGGISVTKDIDFTGFAPNSLSDPNALENKIATINDHCRVLSIPETKDPSNAKNYHWCQANCMDKGGLSSRLSGRQDKVKSFIEKRKNFCKQTLDNYGNLFHQLVQYDRATDTLIGIN